MTPFAAYAAEACRLFILVAMAMAVLGKAKSADSFRETVAAMSGLSERKAGLAAGAVIAAEAVILAALLVTPRAGMAAAMILFALFWAMILIVLLRRRAVICNCFGGGSRPISRLDLLRNLAMIGACAVFLLSPRAPALEPSGWLLLLGTALITFLISSHLDEIAAPAP
jgi:hypothetical protein